VETGQVDQPTPPPSTRILRGPFQLQSHVRIESSRRGIRRGAQAPITPE
jgi:hypothetical protein